MEKELHNDLSGILEDHKLKTEDIVTNSAETISRNGSSTSYIEIKDQSTENVHNRNNDSYTEVGHFADIYKISNAHASDPKAHIVVTKITKDNSTVKIEYVPKSIQYIIEPVKTTTEVIKEHSEDQYTENGEINSDMRTNKTILQNDNTSNVSNNISIKTRKSGSGVNRSVLEVNEKSTKIVLEDNKMKSLHQNNEERKTEIELKTPNLVIDKSLKEPIAYLPYNFILHNIYPGLTINRVVYQQPYHNNLIIKSLLLAGRLKLLNNYKMRPTVVQTVKPKITNLYPYYIG